MTRPYPQLTRQPPITLDPAGRLLLTFDSEEKTIDSPLENLALYKALMLTPGSLPGLALSNVVLGDLVHLKDGVFNSADLDRAASFLAAAADKYGEITIDVVVYLNTILGINGETYANYFDFSFYNYERESTFSGIATVLILQDDSTYSVGDVTIMEKVFCSNNYLDNGAYGFVQAVTGGHHRTLP